MFVGNWVGTKNLHVATYTLTSPQLYDLSFLLLHCVEESWEDFSDAMALVIRIKLPFILTTICLDTGSYYAQTE